MNKLRLASKPVVWERFDLMVWGEFATVDGAVYRKTWVYSDHADNENGVWFYVTSDGFRRGPFETEEEIDDLIRRR